MRRVPYSPCILSPLEPFLIAIALYWAVTLLIEGFVAKVHGIAKERGLGRA